MMQVPYGPFAKFSPALVTIESEICSTFTVSCASAAETEGQPARHNQAAIAIFNELIVSETQPDPGSS
jgi:hypothetical protein